jgi:hypothetical protein
MEGAEPLELVAIRPGYVPNVIPKTHKELAHEFGFQAASEIHLSDHAKASASVLQVPEGLHNGVLVSVVLGSVAFTSLR